jgi:hypothetical protein
MRVILRRGPFGTYLVKAPTGKDLLFQTDWDFPSLARNFGFVPCEDCDTDGTVDCQKYTASQMIDAAKECLDNHIGESFEDPGYF